MKLLEKDVTNILNVKNSKFIAICKRVDNLKSIEKSLKDAKENHPKASHIVYAYIIGENKKYSDDKEPIKTAGFPILKYLEKESVNNILVIVIRYFSPPKLGKNLLGKSYLKVVKDITILKEAKKALLIEFYANYKDESKIDYILKNNFQKIYGEKIKYIAKIPKDKKLNFDYKIIKETLI